MNKKLEEIRKMITENVWLFWDTNTWKHEEKKRFKDEGLLPFEWDGKSRIAFIAENPSEGKMTGNLLNFKRYLDKNGLSGSFVTDLIKRKGEQPKDNLFWSTRDAEILKKEIDLVKPHFIVAVGRSAEKILRHEDYDLGVPVEKIRHYSRTKKDDVQADIKRIARILRKRMKGV